MAGIIIFIVLIVLVLWILASCIRIVPQAYAIVVERLGAYKETWNTGIHFKTPFIDFPLMASGTRGHPCRIRKYLCEFCTQEVEDAATSR